MSSPTKILVIPLKKLIIGAIIAVTLIILLILAVFLFNGNSGSTDSNKTVKTHATYSPGVYSSSIMLNGTPIDIQVTVDPENINSIEMVNLSESITTMYPMLTESFDYIKTEVMKNGSTANITYDAGNKYTATILLEAIQKALDKAYAQ